MSLKRLLCPHCEQSVEVSTTSVTRSRDCPLCGKSIVIQSSSKSGNRRVALLTPVETASVSPQGDDLEVAATGNPEQPKVLTGDLHRRMMHDPEVLARIRILKTGSIVAGSILLFLVLAHVLHFWTGLTSAAAWLGTKLRPGSGQEQIADSEPAVLSPRPALEGLPPVVLRPESTPRLGSPAVDIPRESPARINVPSADKSVPLDSSKAEQKAALDAVLAFLSARTVDERLGHVRERAVVEPRMREYYAQRGDGPVGFERADLVEENPKGPFTYTFAILLADGTRRRTLVGKTIGGKYAVDWASFVLFNEMDWAALRSKKPVEPKMIRALASPAVFFQGAFSDPSALVCVRLIDPQNLEAPALFAYAEANTRLGKAVAEMAQNSAGRSVPVILRIKYPLGAADANQVWIHEFVTQGWVSRQW